MEKRTLLAVVLSLAIIISFQLYMGKRYPQIATQARRTAENTVQASSSFGANEPAIATQSPSPILAEEKETIVETERFVITFTNIGGSIKNIELKDYPDLDTKEAFKLVQISDPKHHIAAVKELYLIPSSELLAYNLTEQGNQIIYTYSTGKIEIEKTYNIHNSLNHIELGITFKNLTDNLMSADYKIIGCSGIDRSEAFSSRFVEVNSKIDGKVTRDKKNSTKSGEVAWVGLKNKYFSIILKPYQYAKSAITERIDKNNLSAAVKSHQFTIPSYGQISHQYLLYAGPNDISRLKQYAMGLEEIVNYGIFGGISKLLLRLLVFFHRIFRNWGVAIICVTAIINLILSPLTMKSYKSMKQLQEIQPHIDKLRQLHKDNPTKLNKELMELYRKYKVNPMGGCLPLFLQMPIVIGMYQGIMRSIELKGSNFLWIKDLSKPDALPLPFSLPFFGDSINLLPILMIVAMIMQQKLSPMSKNKAQTEQQKQQQKMMLFMPLVFGLIFYSLPSGLVLYWLVNTVLMVVNQRRVTRSSVPAIVEG